MALNKEQTQRLSKLSKDELLDFIDVAQKNFWNLQNNYIMYINNEYGEEAAVKADGHCFPANAKVQMYRLRKMFGLKDDVQSLMNAMVLSTIPRCMQHWVLYSIEKAGYMPRYRCISR